MKKLIILIAAACLVFATSCQKEPEPQGQSPIIDHPVDPTIVPTNDLMKGKWWYQRAYETKAVPISRETIIFTSDSTATYYWDYYGRTPSDDEHWTAACVYTFNGTYGRIVMQKEGDDPHVNTGWFVHNSNNNTLTLKKNADDTEEPIILYRSL